MKTIKVSEKNWKALKDLYYVHRLKNIDEAIEIVLQIASRRKLIGLEDYDKSKK